MNNNDTPPINTIWKGTLVGSEKVEALEARIKELEALVANLEDENQELFSQIHEWA